MPYPCSLSCPDIKYFTKFDFGIASMLNHTINLYFDNKIYSMINMEAIPKFDILSVINSDIKFDISIKPTTWIGH